MLPKTTNDPDPASVARQLLLSTASLVEEIRTSHSPTASLPQVIHVAKIDEDNAVLSPYKAAVLSTESFLYSYAISYRLDIRLIRFHEHTSHSEFDRLAKEVLEISSSAPEKPARIYNLQSLINDKPEVLPLITRNLKHLSTFTE